MRPTKHQVGPADLHVDKERYDEPLAGGFGNHCYIRDRFGGRSFKSRSWLLGCGCGVLRRLVVFSLQPLKHLP